MQYLKVDTSPPKPGNGLLRYLEHDVGLEVPSVGSMLGHGEEGEVYAYGSDKIFKVGITSDRDDLIELINLMLHIKRAEKLGCFAKVYDFEVPASIMHPGKPGISYIYFMVVERLTSSVLSVFKFSNFEEEEVIGMLQEYDDPETVEQSAKELVETRRRLGKDHKSAELAMGKVLKFCAGLRESGFAFNDLHLSNVMVDKQKNLKLVDYGFSTAGPAVSISEIAAQLLKAARLLLQ